MIGFFYRSNALSKNNDNYMACCIALETVIYLASIINIAIISYLFVDYDTGSSPTKKIYSLVGLWVFLSFV